MVKIRNLIIFSLCIVMISTLLIGCTKNQVETELEKVETIIVTDCIDREVEVPKIIDKIGCLFAVSGHVVTMLGEGEKIVAVNNGLMRDKLLLDICPSILDAVVPKVSGSINIEELAKVKPDIVFVEIDVIKYKGEAEKFDKFGIPYFVVDFNNIEEQQEMIRKVGKVLGKEVKADNYIYFYNQCIEMVSEKTNEIPLDQRINIYHSVNEATRTDAPNTLPADWTEVAGANNVSVNKELKFVDNKYFASLEQILLWNPEVILVNEDGVEEYILTNKQWENLDAVKNEKVYLLPNGVSRWGHHNSIETPLAILWTSKKLYPDRFVDIDLKKITKDFYKEFFSYELTDEEIERILNGKGMREIKN